MPPGKGRGRGSKDFNPEECCHFLRLALTHPPVGAREWQQLAEVHSQHPAYDRTGPSIQRKYRELSVTQAPTGDPNIPDHVELAYQLKAAISERLMIVSGREDIDLDKDKAANEDGVNEQTSDAQEGNQSFADKDSASNLSDDAQNEAPVLEVVKSPEDKAVEEPLTSSSKQKKPKNTTAPIPSYINAPSVCSRRSGGPGVTQDLLQVTLLQMQEEARKRDEDRKMREEERQHQMEQEQRRREEDRRIREEERREEVRMRREDREEERRNRDQFMQMFLMAFGAHMRGNNSGNAET
jgi:hypothetical protein